MNSIDRIENDIEEGLQGKILDNVSCVIRDNLIGGVILELRDCKPMLFMGTDKTTSIHQSMNIKWDCTVAGAQGKEVRHVISEAKLENADIILKGQSRDDGDGVCLGLWDYHIKLIEAENEFN